MYGKTYLIQLFVTIWIISSTSFTQAHEFWIEPTNYRLKVGDNLSAHLKVGEDFNGNKLAFLPYNFDRFTLTAQGETRDVRSRIGDIPAVGQKAKVDGLHVLAYISGGSELTYTDAETFTNFLAYEGIEWVLEEHKKRGLPELGFKEAYRRYVKSLVSVGSGKGEDRILGLPFEWLVETNPYQSNGDITAQLLWQGKPFTDAQVNVFNKRGKEVTKTIYRTDDKGRVVIKRGEGGQFLLNTVHMIEPSERTQQVSDAVWESLWASVTFEAP